MANSTQQSNVFELVAYEQKWVDGLNRGDISIADEVFADACIIHITGSPERNLSVEAFKEMLKGLLIAFPDLHFSIEDQLVSGDKVALRWVAKGTHTAPLGSIPVTGKPILIDGLILDRVVNGQVSERWEQWDQSGLLQQLGVM